MPILAVLVLAAVLYALWKINAKYAKSLFGTRSDSK
jgi:hypothetical protein